MPNTKAHLVLHELVSRARRKETAQKKSSEQSLNIKSSIRSKGSVKLSENLTEEDLSATQETAFCVLLGDRRPIFDHLFAIFTLNRMRALTLYGAINPTGSKTEETKLSTVL